MTEIDPKLSRLYREASTENPPAALDAAILAAVRKQVSKPQRRKRPWWSRWMVPASLLATLVLGVSIAFLVEREHPETTDDTSIRQIAPRPASPSPARVTESAKAKAADSAAPGVAAKKEAPVAAVPAPVPRPAEPAKSAADAIPTQGRAKATESRMVSESNVATDSAIGGLGATAPAAPAAAAKPARMEQQAIQRSPEAWLDAIRRLKREGRETEAAEQLVEFRKAYPAYAVPETLMR